MGTAERVPEAVRQLAAATTPPCEAVISRDADETVVEGATSLLIEIHQSG
jgi:hypothetical protein